MGLDMYLYAADEEYVEAVKKDVLSNYETSETDAYYEKHGSPDYVYWRKANMIHRYFCNNGECIESQLYYVIHRNQLRKLCDLCRQVLADHEKAEEELPTQSGFFFGSISYDEWYFQDIVYTLESLVLFLEKHDDQQTFLYYASW